jgi:hypothetical protein
MKAHRPKGVIHFEEVMVLLDRLFFHGFLGGLLGIGFAGLGGHGALVDGVVLFVLEIKVLVFYALSWPMTDFYARS